MNLKKTLVAAAVAAVAAAPAISHAEATLYGKVQMALTQSGAKTDTLTTTSTGDTFTSGGVTYNVASGQAGTFGSDKAQTNFTDNGMRLGVKGSDPLGTDMTSFYKIEFDITALGDSTTSYKSTVSDNIHTRFAYAGVKGGFGTVVGGRVKDLFYSMVEEPTDTPNVIGGSLGPTGGGYTSRVDAVAYMTPNLSGFTGGVALGTIGTNNDNTSAEYGKQQQVYELGGKYTFGPGYVGAAYISIPKHNVAIGASGTSVKGVAGVSAGYSFGMFGIDGNITKTQAGSDAVNKDAYKITQATLQGSMSMGSLFGYLMYSTAKSAESGAKSMNRVTAGVFYNVSKPLMVSFEVASSNKYANSGSFTNDLVQANVTGPNGATTLGDPANKYKSNTSVALGLAYSF